MSLTLSHKARVKPVRRSPRKPAGKPAGKPQRRPSRNSPPAGEPVPPPSPPEITDEYLALSSEQRTAYRNPRGDFERMAYVDGRVTYASPFDQLLGTISDEINCAFIADIYPPDGSPIEETRIVNHKPVTFIRRREDHELALTGIHLALPRVYFNAGEHAYENCFDVLTDLADSIRKLAGIVLDIGEQERRERGRESDGREGE
jgi:hypothetical protein